MFENLRGCLGGQVSGRPSGNSSGLAIVNNMNKNLNWSRVEGWLIA